MERASPRPAFHYDYFPRADRGHYSLHQSTRHMIFTQCCRLKKDLSRQLKALTLVFCGTCTTCNLMRSSQWRISLHAFSISSQACDADWSESTIYWKTLRTSESILTKHITNNNVPWCESNLCWAIREMPLSLNVTWVGWFEFLMVSPFSLMQHTMESKKRHFRLTNYTFAQIRVATLRDEVDCKSIRLRSGLHMAPASHFEPQMPRTMFSTSSDCAPLLLPSPLRSSMQNRSIISLLPDGASWSCGYTTSYHMSCPILWWRWLLFIAWSDLSCKPVPVRINETEKVCRY